MPKSFVSYEQKRCPVCGVKHDTGGVLMDLTAQPTLETHTVTGWRLCPPCDRLHDLGYVAMVEADQEKTRRMGYMSAAAAAPECAWRTGRVAHVPRETLAQEFEVPVEEDLVLVFVEVGMIDKVMAAMPHGVAS